MQLARTLVSLLATFSLFAVIPANAQDTTAPTVSLTAPAAGALVRGTVTVSATASDNVGVMGVSFWLDGVNIGNEDQTLPYSVSWNTTTASAGAHTLTAIARDGAGNTTTSAPVGVTVDNAAPTGTIQINGGAATTATASVTLTLSATDNIGPVTQMRFSNSSTQSTFSAPEAYGTSKAWTLTSGSGSKTVYAQYQDAAGNWSGSFTATIAVDTAPPTVTLTAPANGALLRGSVTVSATATDDWGVAGVTFKLDGNNIGSEDTSSPYSVSWNTASTTFGQHQLTAVARDKAGKLTMSAPITVNTDNTAPTGNVVINNGDAVTASAAVTLTLSATDNSGTVTQMRFSNSSTQSTFSAPEPYATSKSWALSAGSGTKTVYVQYGDQAGNWSGSFTDKIIVDGAPPTVSVSAPANGASVRSTVTLTASAADDAGIAGVQFQVDGVNLGSEDTSSPYSASWNTTSATNASHTITAIARDISGNTTPSSPVSVTVDNVAPTGSVVINNGATSTGSTAVTLTLSATDNSGTVAQMRFSNSSTQSTFSAAEPYNTNKAWTLTSGSGTKTVYAQFADAAGNWSGSFTKTITLDTTAPTISSVNATSNGSGTGATVTWTTNEASTSRVEFGTTTSYGTLTDVDPALVTSHSVTLSSLTPQTTYNYRPRSADGAGNEAVNANKTFKTLGTDSVPPTTPASLTATSASASSIALSWPASTDNVGVTKYIVYRGGVQVATPTGTSYSDTGLQPLTTYTYNVAAQDAAGNVSGQSPSASATTGQGADTTAPTVAITAPTDGSTVGGDTVALTADASDPAGAGQSVSGVAGVQLLLNSANLGTEITNAPYTFNWNTITVNKGQYSLAARARDVAGNTATSSAVVVTVDNNDSTPPSVPAGLTATTASRNQINLSWTASTDDLAVQGYRLYRNGSLIATTGNTTWSDTGLGLGQTYAYTIQAFDYSNNYSAVSDPVNGMTLTDTIPPAAIANLTAASCDATSCRLTWNSQGDDGSVGTAASYDLRYSTSPIDDTTWYSATPVAGVPAPLVAGTAQNMTVRNLAGTTTYYFAMRSTDAYANVSPTSNVAQGTTTSGFSFVVYGDSRAGSCPDNADHVAIINRIQAANPTFVFHVGDMIQGYGNQTNWVQNGGCTAAGQKGSFKDMIAPLATVPPPAGLPTAYFPVLGNHDDDWGDGWYPDSFNQGACDAYGASLVRQLVPNHTTKPYFKDKSGSNYPIYDDNTFYSLMCSTTINPVYGDFFYYSFDYNNSHFVVMRISSDWFDLKTVDNGCTAATETNYDKCYNIHQLHWLQADLAAAKANPNIKHIFGFMHAPDFTTGQDHPASASASYVATEFSKVGGKIVFSGHNHLYERTVPILVDAAHPNGVRDDVLGTRYITTGGGGSPLNDFNAAQWFDVTRASVKHFTKVTVTGDSVSVQAIDINGNTVDSFGF